MKQGTIRLLFPSLSFFSLSLFLLPTTMSGLVSSHTSDLDDTVQEVAASTDFVFLLEGLCPVTDITGSRLIKVLIHHRPHFGLVVMRQRLSLALVGLFQTPVSAYILGIAANRLSLSSLFAAVQRTKAFPASPNSLGRENHKQKAGP